MKRSPRVVVIGIWILIAATALYFGINYLKGLSVFSANNTYYARFQDVSGMSVAAPIFVNGYKVGSVQSMDFDLENGGATCLQLSIKKEHRIPSNTRAVIHQSLLGGAQIDLYLGDAQTYLAPGDTLTVAPKEKEVMDALNNDIIPYIERMLPQADSLITQLNTISHDRSVGESINNIRLITARAAAAVDKIDQLSATLLKTANSDLPRIGADLSNASGRICNFSEQLDSVNLTLIAQNLEQTSVELKQIMRKVNEGDGSVSQLVNDPSLYNRLDSLVNSADVLINDIKQHPKKYLKISIF